MINAEVECGLCDETIGVDVKTGADGTTVVDLSGLKEAGRVTNDYGDHLCPGCQDSGTDEGGE